MNETYVFLRRNIYVVDSIRMLVLTIVEMSSPPLYLTDDIKKMQKTPKQTDPNRRFHNSTGLRKRCDLHHCGCNGVQCFPPTVPASPKWRDGSCSTWQVNCCHLVDESKTATKAWTRNEKKKCPQTYEDQESLGSKSGRISFFKIFIWM